MTLKDEMVEFISSNYSQVLTLFDTYKVPYFNIGQSYTIPTHASLPRDKYVFGSVRFG